MQVLLSPTDVAIAALFLVGAGLLSLWLELGLARGLAVAALRMVAQLAAVGIVLKFVLEQASPLWALLIGLVMLAAAAFEVAQRQELRSVRALIAGLAAAVLATTAVPATLLTVVLVIGPDPWHDPRYLVPLLGMIMGNALSAASTALAALRMQAKTALTRIEARLAMGADRSSALREAIREAVRLAVMPTINSMSVMGLVTLPGTMSGQILAGADPIEAAKYQLVIMLAVAGASITAAIAAALGGIRVITDSRHRIRRDRLG
jgi:putative ABC transport system permease protein